MCSVRRSCFWCVVVFFGVAAVGACCWGWWGGVFLGPVASGSGSGSVASGLFSSLSWFVSVRGSVFLFSFVGGGRVGVGFGVRACRSGVRVLLRGGCVLWGCRLVGCPSGFRVVCYGGGVVVVFLCLGWWCCCLEAGWWGFLLWWWW